MLGKLNPRHNVDEDTLGGWGLVPGDVDELSDNIFEGITENPDKLDFFILRVMMQPENIYLATKLIFNVDLLPFQAIIIGEMWRRSFPMFIASRGASKSYQLGLYALMRATLIPGRKIVITAAGFRQAKQVFEYCERIWNNAPVLRSLFPKTKNDMVNKATDKWVMYLGESQIIAIPTGNGETIRGIRANDVLIDEFKSGNREIIETVISGFGAVSSDPVGNVRREARLKRMLAEGKMTKEEAAEIRSQTITNQMIISGTAYFAHNHFFSYYQKYKKIIESQGDPLVMRSLLGEDTPLDEISHKDFVIVRLPYELLPDGFMDKKVIARSKSTISEDIFNCEYNACFVNDSSGFFKISLLDKCTSTEDPSKIITHPSGPVIFNVATQGRLDKVYVLGIDPASERDNLAITVLEVWPDHRRIVYVWTTNRRSHERQKLKFQNIDQDYYRYSARKVRNLMNQFNITDICIDPDGGGRAIVQALGDPVACLPGELPIFPAIVPGKPLPTDGESGLHCLHYSQFSNAKWLAEANHGMKFDFETQKLVFPMHDPALYVVLDTDNEANDLSTYSGHVDNLGSVLDEINETKLELMNIVVTSTSTGREQFDTPEIKMDNARKGRMRKDRYSSLLMANMLARSIELGNLYGNNKFYSPDGSTGGRGSTADWAHQRDKVSGGYTGGMSWYNEWANRQHGA